MNKLLLFGFGLFINKKLNKIIKNQRKNDTQINSDKYSFNIDDEDIQDEDIEKYNEYVSKSEAIIKKIETFENSKILHGIINNTIAINNKGFIFITSYGIIRMFS